MEGLREEVCVGVEEINVVLGRERDYYINVIIVVLELLIARTLKLKY